MQKSIHTESYAIMLELLIEVREAANLTQKELAERLTVTQSSVSKVERGERRLDVAELYNWCRAIGYSFKKFATVYETRLQQRA